MQGNVTILVTWANAMQASWCYRGAGGSVLVAMGAGCQHGTDAGQLVLSGCWCSVLVAMCAACQQGNGCSRPAGAIDALRLWAGALWVQGTDAGQLVLLGC